MKTPYSRKLHTTKEMDFSDAFHPNIKHKLYHTDSRNTSNLERRYKYIKKCIYIYTILVYTCQKEKKLF